MDRGPRAPELTPNLGWLNTDRELRFSDELKGHVVLLDFWTYCCINCMHVLPDLHYLEHAFKDEPFVVIGVHSAKFDNESDRRNVRNAVQRYEIAHPVVVDKDMNIWRKYTVRAWPTLVVVGADGRIVGAVSGEGNRDILERAIRRALDDGRREGTLAATPFPIKLDASVPSATGLAFPGKVHADAATRRIFIADSGHHRVLAATWPDDAGRSDLLRVYGAGEAGFVDGEAGVARFTEPQGLTLVGETLYVADRRNHSVRAIDLDTGRVSTVVGDGAQGRDRRGGGVGAAQRLNSPWDLAHNDGAIYIAMAGSHQIWRLDPSTGRAGVYAGSGIETITDGAPTAAAFSQPSGLAVLGGALFVADAEVSAVRRIDLASGKTSTIIGTGLFDFGDVDGAYPRAMLQHCKGVAAYGEMLLVADTYNHKIKLVDPARRTAHTWLGTGEIDKAPGARTGDPHALTLYEPGGLHLAGEGADARLFIADTNNHRVIVVDPETLAWHELMINGLEGADPIDEDAPRTSGAVGVRPGHALTLELSPTLPDRAHPNPDAPVSIRVVDEAGATLAQRTLRTDRLPVRIEVPGAAAAPGRWRVEIRMAYCTDGDRAVCVPFTHVWDVLATAAADAPAVATLGGG
ncbi:MAG: hypothetical protein EA379_11620 [Phycisphaerales bacterium]|nr:MAG: hypothetical protein EA379_11620 [Phycisphaerales bacterium]